MGEAKVQAGSKKHRMVRLLCPVSGAEVWGNSLKGLGFRCTKCGNVGHSEASTKSAAAKK